MRRLAGFISVFLILLAACASDPDPLRLTAASNEMENTIQIGATIVVDEFAYTDASSSSPQRADIIVFVDPREIPDDVLPGFRDAFFLKRVIALGGELIEIRDNQVWIDGVVLDEPYVKPGSAMPDHGPLVIPDGHLFVMGDNRNSSQDSRFFGSVPISTTYGKVVEISSP